MAEFNLSIWKMQNFEKLPVYKDSQVFVNYVYQITKKFPREEIFGLVSQFRRAAISIPLNIAEGQGRKTYKDHKQFLIIARGSLNEMIAITDVCLNQNLIYKEEYQETREKIKSLLMQLNLFIKYLEKKQT